MATHIPAAPAPSENEPIRVIERPDGFYWQDSLTDKQYGPFPTLLEAMQDMEGHDDRYAEGESLEDAEAEIGIADWIDPDTGEPAEGVLPRISDK